METGKVSTVVPSIPGYEEIVVEACFCSSSLFGRRYPES